MGGNARRQGARWCRQHVVPVGLLALLGAGCNQASNHDGAAVTTTATSATTTATSATVAGPATFVAEARTMGFGTKDLASASERELLQLGRVVCDGLGIKGVGFRRVVGRLVHSDACPTTAQATALVRSAVRNLCPQHAGAILN